MRITEQTNEQLEAINIDLKEKQQKLKASANEAMSSVIGEDLFKQIGLKFQDNVVDADGVQVELKNFNFKLSKNKEDYICSFTVQYPDEIERILLPTELFKVEVEVESKRARKTRTPKTPKVPVIADQVIDAPAESVLDTAKQKEAEAIFNAEPQEKTPTAPEPTYAPVVEQNVVPTAPEVVATPEVARSLQVKLPTDVKATEYPTPTEAFGEPVTNAPVQYGTPRVAPIATENNNPFGN